MRVQGRSLSLVSKRLGLAILPAVVVMGLIFVLAARAAPGDLDPGFGDGGVVVTDLRGGDDHIRDIVIQPDGKIVAAGAKSINSDYSDFALARYNSDGSLDTNFGDSAGQS